MHTRGAEPQNSGILPDEVAGLLASEGIAWDAVREGMLKRYLDTLAAWGHVVQTVSGGDEQAVLWRHVVDSLSLSRLVRAYGGSNGWLDVGSGAGFPGLVGAIALPEVSVTLVERSGKRAGLLRKGVGACGLQNVRVICGEFPGTGGDSGWGVVTARAVEQPGRLWGAFAEVVEAGAVFLCQQAKVPAGWGEMFHVEHVEDAWRARGWRRGSLWVVRRRSYVIVPRGTQP